MADDWRVVQYFLSKSGVDTVEIQGEYAQYRCSCTTYHARRRCKHVNFVRDATRSNGGTFPMRLLGVTREDVEAAHKDADEFRALMAKHSKVEIL